MALLDRGAEQVSRAGVALVGGSSWWAVSSLLPCPKVEAGDWSLRGDLTQVQTCLPWDLWR